MVGMGVHKPFFKNALKEDMGDGDHTSLASIPASATSKAHLLIKDDGIIAGIELAKMIFNEVEIVLFRLHVKIPWEVPGRQIALGGGSGDGDWEVRMHRSAGDVVTPNMTSASGWGWDGGIRVLFGAVDEVSLGHFLRKSRNLRWPFN